MIEKVMNAMVNSDCKALAELFAEESRYCDFMPGMIGKNNYHVYGRKSIEMFFHHEFFFRNLVVTNTQIENEQRANYLAAYAGEHLHAQISIREVDDDGKIVHLTVRPM